MKKYFTSGLALLLPVILTLMILNFLINFFTQPFLNSTQAILENLLFYNQTSLSYHQETAVLILSKFIIIFVLAVFTILVGLFGKLFLIDLFFRLGDYLLHKLPFINKIYRACKDVVHSLFSSSSNKFNQVVFVPFPSPENLSIGLVTSHSVQLDSQDSEQLVSVFVPGTPNPSVGFLLMFKKEQLILANMKVDEAMKFIVSCGLVMPDFKIIQYEENDGKDKANQNKDCFSPCQKQYRQNTIDLHESPGSLQP